MQSQHKVSSSNDDRRTKEVESNADALLLALTAFEKECNQMVPDRLAIGISNKGEDINNSNPKGDTCIKTHSSESSLEDMLTSLGAALEANRKAGNGDNWKGKPQQQPIWGRGVRDGNADNMLEGVGTQPTDNTDDRAGRETELTVKLTRDVLTTNYPKRDINGEDRKFATDLYDNDNVVDVLRFRSDTSVYTSKDKVTTTSNSAASSNESLSDLVGLYCKQLKANCRGVFPVEAFGGSVGGTYNLNVNGVDAENMEMKKEVSNVAVVPLSSEYDGKSLTELCEELTKAVLKAK